MGEAPSSTTLEKQGDNYWMSEMSFPNCRSPIHWQWYERQIKWQIGETWNIIIITWIREKNGGTEVKLEGEGKVDWNVC